MISNFSQSGGIYVHVPFCLKKCPYCDFYSISDLSLMGDFTNALLKEIAMIHLPFSWDSFYMGGGTPSVLEIKHIAKILEAFTFSSDTEITIEANPGTINFEKMCQLKKMGFNRINMGVQSFLDKNLKFLGRIHSGDQAKKSINQARLAGFKNIGFDLIYGLPDQSKSDWQKDLDQAFLLAPEHLSCYMLSYETGTPLEQRRRKGDFKALCDDRQAELFMFTVNFLNAHGYEQYEISNFVSSKKSRSRHNQKYWSGVPYAGFGPSAHSFFPPERHWNTASVRQYIDMLNSGRLPIAETEILSKDQEIMEAIYLSLRTVQGICIYEFEKRFSLNFEKSFGKIMTELREKQWIEPDPSRCALSLKGRVLLDAITSRLVCQEFYFKKNKN